MTGKHRLMAGAIAGAGLIGVMGAATVSAATTSGTGTLANKLATTFHLNQADVQKVLDQNHADRDAQRAAEQKTRLDAAVKAGTITAAQETLIINKQAELQAAREAKRDSVADAATRQAAMKTERDALIKWATDNKIPMNLLMGGHGPGGHGGPDGDNDRGTPPTS